MPTFLKRPALAVVALSLISAFAAGKSARADDFPSHPIHLIVPYAAGGSADATARVLARQIGKRTGQTIVVENRGGSAAIVGTEVVNKADPDGYTLLLGQSGPISINPAIYKDLPYDPVKDFAPISLTSMYPYIMVVNRSLGVKTVQEFVALAKSKPGALNYGTTGVGAANHLITELFNLKAGIKMTHIPYRGTSLAVADLVAGQVQVVFSDPISALQLVKSGVLVALAVSSKDRSPVAPELPTISESGYPGFDASRLAWHPGTGQDAAGDHRQAQHGDRAGVATIRKRNRCSKARRSSSSALLRKSSPATSNRTSRSGKMSRSRRRSK